MSFMRGTGNFFGESKMNIINQVTKMQSDLIQGKSIKLEDVTTLRVKLEMLSEIVHDDKVLEKLGDLK